MLVEEAAMATAPPRGRDFREVLAGLTALPGVRGGLVVAADGLAIAAQLPPSVPVEPLSALAATLGRELEVRATRFRRAGFGLAEFAADDGAVFLGSTPIGFVVVVAERDANREAVKQALRSALDAVRQAWRR